MSEMPFIELLDDLKYAFHTRVVELQELKEKQDLMPKKTKKAKQLEEDFNSKPKYKNSFTA